jgi:hypothetical protein
MSKSIYTETITVTPKLAEQWLNGNTHNRALRDPHVDFLASEITGGRWKENGETIKFSPTKQLIDGQHRLFAVIEAGKSIRALVAWNVSPDSFHTIDVGVVRTAGDTLGVDGEEHGPAMAAALMALDDILVRNGSKPNGRTPNARIRQLLEENADIREAVADVKQTKLGKVLPNGPAAALLCLFKRKDSVLAGVFAQAVATGVGLAADDPFYQLREMLQRNQKEKAKLPRIYIMAVTIKAWNRARDNRSSKALRWAAAESFPVIK